MLKRDIPAVILAPMEGVTDARMREFLTRSGYFDYCVSEFIRVSENVLSPKNFLKHVPELLQNSRTPSLIPVQIQLLGGNATRLAESARNAIQAGAQGVDLNFGCPAPTVNRHDGGATLLKYPERIEEIVRAVRDAVPSQFPVSAKLRLGFDDPNAIYENARRVEQGGASWITIHGRTKTQGYIPPAYWKPIGKVKLALSIPVVANGEIWNVDDFKRCQEETGSIHFMLGRGALAVPNLARDIRRELGLAIIATPHPLRFPEAADASEWHEVLSAYLEIQPSEKRLKQWLRYLQSRKNIVGWDELKGLQSGIEILNRLKQLLESPSSALPEQELPAQIPL
ncbi:MAG: tRNA-dihydrouridine synthase family protein [Bdellovibrionales bacterium]|nr:tRNA-dihydrouridine synthase family protein [Oligoflexia bacterium]